MRPFINVFGIGIPSYGLLNALGISAGIVIAVLRAEHNKREDVFYCCLFGVIGVGVGAAALHFLINIPLLISTAELIGREGFFVWLSQAYGLVFYGGLFGGILGAFIYCKAFKIEFWPLFETIVPSIPLMHSIGRIGCFMGGCCFGIPWSGRLAVTFSESLGAPNGIGLFPVQLLEAGLLMALFIVMLVYARRPRPRGSVTGLYLLIYAFIRLITERFRWDEARRFFLGVSTSQWISLILIPVSLCLLIIPRISAGKRRQ